MPITTSVSPAYNPAITAVMEKTTKDTNRQKKVRCKSRRRESAQRLQAIEVFTVKQRFSFRVDLVSGQVIDLTSHDSQLIALLPEPLSQLVMARPTGFVASCKYLMDQEDFQACHISARP